MNLTFRQLKVFEAVARHASYTRAAEELHLTQPAVSIQVKSLEDMIGFELFEQRGKQIHLTSAGEEMQRYSRTIAAQIDEIGDLVNRIKDVTSGSIRISIVATVNYAMPPLLLAFRHAYPDISINLTVANRQTLLQQLEEQCVDLAVMGEPPVAQGLTGQAFMENPLVVIAPPDHALASRQLIPLKMIVDQPFIVREEGSGTRAAITQFERHHRITLNPALVMASDEAIKQAVRAGFGLGLVSRHTLDLELDAGRLQILNIAHFPIGRHWYIVHRENKRLSPAVETFKNFLIDNAATAGAAQPGSSRNQAI